MINAFFNWVFIYGHLGVPPLGVPGSAWATFVARLYMAGLLAAVVWWTWEARPSGMTATGVTVEPDRHRFAGSIELGLPAATTVTAEVGVFAVATALAGQLEPVATASHQIALNIAAVAFMIPLGLASAGAVRVGNAVGARNPHGAAAAGWTVIAMGVAFMLCSGALFIAAPRVLIGLFTSDEAVLALGRSLLFIAAVFQLFDGLQGVVTGTLRGLGDTRTPMVTNLAAHWLIGLPVGLLALLLGRLGRARPLVGPLARSHRGRHRADGGVGATRGPAAQVGRLRRSVDRCALRGRLRRSVFGRITRFPRRRGARPRSHRDRPPRILGRATDRLQ